METKIKNLLARLAFFAEEGMADAPIVAIAKDADALLKEMCRAQQQVECGSCNGFNSGCEECSGLGKDGHLAALRQLANVAHRVAHAMGLPAGFDVTTLPDVVAQRLTAQQQAEPVAYPPYSVFSNSDGDSWEEHPASDCFVHGKKLGEEFELLAGWQAERVTFRVTKVPDDESDDYEVEEVTAQAAAQKGGQ